jgi:hypothetical protein
MSEDQQPALTAQAKEDAIRASYKELSVSWGKTRLYLFANTVR